MTPKPAPDATRVLTILLRNGGFLSANTRFDNVERVNADIVAIIQSLDTEPKDRTKWFGLRNADTDEPSLMVDARWIAGWYFYEPSNIPERHVKAVEKLAKPIDAGDEWKQGGGS